MKAAVVLTILLATFIATIVSEEQLENNELSEDLIPDLFTEGQRLRFYRFRTIQLVRNKETVPAKPASGFSGYRPGYGAFRGRRSSSQTENL
ncbi:hypothetical protein DAPPUDRAFT_303669 [Daphnia pulex]|uniref:Uncharacterized protein n=1 Tax=Daphnia pulex TaxID=6669 RepID=E9GHQ2_DAPPU|nr:hypothetical protein DAPPUDRAFT_303669 [Daphnia pulex]|eukprot:EFX81014.1 hypothetical protein DAPPUDRAFT_303669 [Daphnia pulex]